MELSKLKTNVELEDNGVAIPFGDASVTIRSRQSEVYRNVMKRLFKPHESSMALGVLPDAVAKDLMIRGSAEGLIVSWSGFTEGGEPVSYSVDKAIEYLGVSAFRNFVDENADKMDNFREAKEAAETKNS